MRVVPFDGESLITPELINGEIRPHGRHYFNGGAKRRLIHLLDKAYEEFSSKSCSEAEIISSLTKGLHEIRVTTDGEMWRTLISAAQVHPVAEFFLQDPFTRWSFEKPRGYSGDAQLLDFIYGHPSVRHKIEQASAVGRQLYDYTKDASSSVAVRERRDILTREVDELAARLGGDAEVLAIAAGHLREANNSVALREGSIKRWVALDQDPLSVGSIERDFAATNVQAVRGSVRGILTDSYKLGQFDFVYAAGLYDYLSEKVAVKLTQRCLQMLKPNGAFLFANFADEIEVDGYMETFMNWALLLRTEADMWQIINASADPDAYDAKVYFGENRNVIYGCITKRSMPNA